MVSVAVTAPVPEMIAAGALVEQVGMSTAPEGLAVTAQVSATLPVKPPLGVTVMVEVPFVPGDVMLIAVLVSVKLGVTLGALTVTATLVVVEVLPEVPVTVTVYAPGLVAASVLMVSVSFPAAAPVIVAGEAMEQVGVPVALLGVTAHDRATLPVKLPLGVIEMVDVADAP
jgi:hypothetical protein